LLGDESIGCSEDTAREACRFEVILSTRLVGAAFRSRLLAHLAIVGIERACRRSSSEEGLDILIRQLSLAPVPIEDYFAF
jgi:hypothetical protein